MIRQDFNKCIISFKCALYKIDNQRLNWELKSKFKILERIYFFFFLPTLLV